MTPTKDDVKKWLKSIGKNREWLGQQCHVDKRTVDSWFFASGQIPALKLDLIKHLMKTSDTETGRPPVVNVTLDSTLHISVSRESYDRFVILAHEHGLSVEEWVAWAMNYAGENSDKISAYIEVRKKTKSPASDTNIIVGLATKEEELA
ncbi:hypothetical protein QET93_007625 [Akkermansia sp. N21116]|uniref:hypothetical protein n=1 Tax=Akkermansia sp. N21116 TaxID=3040764 RepID=UPI00244E69AB|nr:hypothetical protein [Akkermansia sp. N21116]WPX39404.1 hypothetical protein QET93_007625 [Akkermansia sp. N21116]